MIPYLLCLRLLAHYQVSANVLFRPLGPNNPDPYESGKVQLTSVFIFSLGEFVSVALAVLTSPYLLGAQSQKRIAGFFDVIDESGVETTIWEHHPSR